MSEIGDLIRQYPYPVARPLAVAFGITGNHSVQTRLWNIPFAGYQLVRTTLLPVISAYLEDPIDTARMPDQRAAARIAHHVAMLHCPYYNTWFSLLNTLADELTIEKVGIRPVMPIQRAIEALNRSQSDSFSPRYGAQGKLSPQDAIYGLRNGIQRSGGIRDEATCQSLLRHYLPVLTEMTRVFDFLADCRLAVRENGDSWNGNDVRFLTGPETRSPAPPEPLTGARFSITLR